MLFVLGDSHARSLHRCRDDDPHVVERPSGNWMVLGTGGATAYSLMDQDSASRAGLRSSEYVMSFDDDDKAVILMFGDVDCVDHVWQHGDDIGPAVEGLHTFMSHLLSLPGVTSVMPCAVYPRTSAFSMHDRSAADFNATIEAWNSAIGECIDPSPLLSSDDGFLLPEFCHSVNDAGERHLSPSGIEVVWQTFDRFASVSAWSSKPLKR